MRVTQDSVGFAPIHIVLESEEEVQAFWRVWRLRNIDLYGHDKAVSLWSKVIQEIELVVPRSIIKGVFTEKERRGEV